MATLDNEEVKLIAEALVDAGIVEQELPSGILFSSKLQKLRLILQSLIEAKVIDQEQDAAYEKANTKIVPMDLSPQEALHLLKEALTKAHLKCVTSMQQHTVDAYSYNYGSGQYATGLVSLSVNMEDMSAEQVAALINHIRKFAV
jgi:hypothetical protein